MNRNIGSNDRTSNPRAYDLQERLIDFSVRIINLVESLPKSRVADHVAGQRLRSGTSAAANYGEAQSGESRKDLVHKLKIALKELRESYVWLEIIRRRGMVESTTRMDGIVSECNELIATFVASIGTVMRKEDQLRRPPNLQSMSPPRPISGSSFTSTFIIPCSVFDILPLTTPAPPSLAPGV